MADDPTRKSRSGPLKPLTDIGGRAAAATLRPLTDAVVGAAAEAGISEGERAVDRLLESGELERLLAGARLQAVVEQMVGSEGATQLIDTFFDSGVFDRFVDRLLASDRLIDTFFDSGLFDQFVDRLLSSDGLWRLVDEIAASPTVRAAVSQQGLGFADQVGEAVRARSRNGDRRLERAAHRLMRHPTESPQIAAQTEEDGQPAQVS